MPLLLSHSLFHTLCVLLLIKHCKTTEACMEQAEHCPPPLVPVHSKQDSDRRVEALLVLIPLHSS